MKNSPRDRPLGPKHERTAKRQSGSNESNFPRRENRRERRKPGHHGRASAYGDPDKLLLLHNVAKALGVLIHVEEERQRRERRNGRSSIGPVADCAAQEGADARQGLAGTSARSLVPHVRNERVANLRR